jgi:hypothetical protein
MIAYRHALIFLGIWTEKKKIREERFRLAQALSPIPNMLFWIACVLALCTTAHAQIQRPLTYENHSPLGIPLVGLLHMSIEDFAFIEWKFHILICPLKLRPTCSFGCKHLQHIQNTVCSTYRLEYSNILPWRSNTEIFRVDDSIWLGQELNFSYIQPIFDELAKNHNNLQSRGKQNWLMFIKCHMVS